MYKKLIISGLLSLGAFSIIQTPIQTSADAYPTTSIIDQIEHPNRGISLNHNGARNWQMSNNQYLLQATTNGQITYQIVSKDPYYQKIWQDAINAWNNLDVIKFVPTTQNAQVTLGGDKNANRQNDWYGSTGTASVDDGSNQNVTYMWKSSARLAGDLSKKASHYQLNLTIAEHEIGHTLGFAHDNTNIRGKYHVMHGGIGLPFVKNIQPLGNYEKQTLLKYYTPGKTKGPQGNFPF